MNEERFVPIQIVKKQLEEKKSKCSNNIDELTRQKLDFISNMLNNERCFFTI